MSDAREIGAGDMLHDVRALTPGERRLREADLGFLMDQIMRREGCQDEEGIRRVVERRRGL